MRHYAEFSTKDHLVVFLLKPRTISWNCVVFSLSWIFDSFFGSQVRVPLPHPFLIFMVPRIVVPCWTNEVKIELKKYTLRIPHSLSLLRFEVSLRVLGIAFRRVSTRCRRLASLEIRWIMNISTPTYVILPSLESNLGPRTSKSTVWHSTNWAKKTLLFKWLKIINLFQKSRSRPWTSIGRHLFGFVKLLALC